MCFVTNEKWGGSAFSQFPSPTPTAEAQKLDSEGRQCIVTHKKLGGSAVAHFQRSCGAKTAKTAEKQVGPYSGVMYSLYVLQLVVVCQMLGASADSLRSV